MDLMEEVKLRAMKKHDLEAIARIDHAILGMSRLEYWENKVASLERRSGIAPLVAEIEGNVVGFIIGEASGWEYGVPEEVGWIHTLGVDPACQNRGTGALLVREMLGNMKKVGVCVVYTLVNWRDAGMLRFFNRMGFEHGDMLNLQKRL
jgi:N-acetylglutamate synthase-like GNAT family acetyltransferase